MIAHEYMGYDFALPETFLPAALPALQGAKDYRVSVFLTGREGSHVRSLDAGTIRDQKRLRALLEAPERLLRIPKESGIRRIASARDTGRAIAEDGPFDVAFGPAVEGEVFRTLPPVPKVRKGSEGPPYIAILDAGIAFWNAAFLAPGGPGFAAMGGLRIGPGTGPAVEWLDETALAGIPAAGRPAAVARAGETLARSLVESVFADGAQDPRAFSHGTAMAALAASRASRKARLIGLELPVRLGRDASGGILSSVIDLAIRAAVSKAVELETKAGRGRPQVTLCLAYAFTGGPSDGTHPALRRLERVLGELADHADIRLVVPTGNHLQEDLHARPDRDGDRIGFDWQIPWGDPSANGLELILPAHDAFDLSLVDPSGQGTQTDLGRAGRYGLWLLFEGGAVMGALQKAPSGAGGTRLRLVLAPTARDRARPGRALARPGRWQVALTDRDPCRSGEADPVAGWILRDDADLPEPGRPPRRQSWFADRRRPLHDGIGVLETDDAPRAGDEVRRLGTASVLATIDADALAAGTGGRAGVTVATASWTALGRPASAPAPYAGRVHPDHPRTTALHVVDAPGPAGGTPTIATATPRRVRVSGTSVAAALEAGRPAAP
ncbi:hypothetical protein LX81_02919 [Palleronia aestuarii]|uniref:Subtilase family protein n=1 Tax=Palleronia aestuarii TaxID=568105 RepID=A0A2W7NMF0_9RHOB|nr:hypothetical protein [Palleronia aestuarii]PZX14336.1 hypothetical protein LX81_02919 [Palleronia aestuarii]